MKIIEEIRKELKENVDEDYRQGSIKYFKEKVVLYGVRASITRKIAQKYFKEIKGLDKKEIFNLIEILLKSQFNEEAHIAFNWLAKLVNKLEEKDFLILEKWLGKYIDNWAKCDDFCTHIINPMISRFPNLIKKVKSWSLSKNRWLRRASSVSFITTRDSFYVTNGRLKDIFEVAEILLEDNDDLVQKGYGWMLKATSINYQKEVFDFVMKRKNKMPRTALRYAIEKMPKSLKKKAME